MLHTSPGYAKRAARALRDDPMPYLASALLLGIFEVCGLPGIAGYRRDHSEHQKALWQAFRIGPAPNGSLSAKRTFRC